MDLSPAYLSSRPCRPSDCILGSAGDLKGPGSLRRQAPWLSLHRAFC